MKVVAVIPTYNERANIEPLIAALCDAASVMPHQFEVLVVDDESPDRTGDVVRSLQEQRPNVRLLSGSKQGLGVAYARGLRYALAEMDADAVVHMDADFSHDPADLPRLVAKIDEGYDLVVGARYIDGGGLPADWGVGRRLISRVANMGARRIAGITALHDCTNGYRAYRASTLARVDLEQAPRGYAVLTYLAYQSLMTGARLAEVPITFSNRAHGTSKLRLADMTEFFVNAWWIRYDRRERFYRYASGGLSSVAANLTAVALLYYSFGLPAVVASVLAIEASVLFSVCWRQWWGRALGRAGSGMPGIAVRVHVMAVPSAVLTLGSFVLLRRAGVEVVLAQAIGLIPALVWNYFIGDRGLDMLRRMNILSGIEPGADTADSVVHGRS